MEHPGPSPLGGASRLLSELEAWVATAAADAAVEERRRTHGLARQATEEATLAGVLVDLAERHAPTVLATMGGRRHRGVVQLLGDDLVIAAVEPRGVALVRTSALVSVRTAPGTPPVTGDRMVQLGVTLADAMTVLADDRPRAHLGLAGGSTCTGEIRAVGADVVTVRLDGEGGAAYVPIGAIEDVVVDDVTVTDAFR